MALNITLTAINTVVAIVTLPLVTGLTIRWFDQSDSVSLPLVEVVKADYLADVGLVTTLFCAVSLVVGYVVPRAFGVADDQAVASSFEIGVHNGTLAIFVAVEVLDSVEASVPAAVYSLAMFVLAAAWGAFISRRVAARRESATLAG